MLTVRRAWKQSKYTVPQRRKDVTTHQPHSAPGAPTSVRKGMKMAAVRAAVWRRSPLGSCTLTRTSYDLLGWWGAILPFTDVEMEALARGFTDPELEPIQQSTQGPTGAGTTVGPEPGACSIQRASDLLLTDQAKRW